ncbi:Uncharacterized protein LSUE1_G001916 [Lachnellula suecica]|uniref:Uncharacterized protein n=1 Tax=Lachnellula suecica TaxID=602035 RepID=A0A8T9CEE5_9HELO|nr:Uncharacterized protein LSUE1_G001916 [Lachnellula suecica]
MTESLSDVLYDIRRDINTSSDPRVGSARDNSTGTSISRVPTQGTNSSSFATLFTTFIPLAVFAAICIIIFLVLRRKISRAYSPRTFLSSLDVHDRSSSLPSGWFNWFKPFYQTPDTVVLNHSSLDGFLFLRYLKILCVICGVGCLLTWPILLPYHAKGGGDNIQLDLLTFGNVVHPSWFFLHAFLAWIYFGFILYMVARECVYFISLRQAYLLSPLYSSRLSSRTVLFTSVPQQILDERKLRRVFGDTVKNIWIPRETEELDDLVKEREQTAERLEKAEILLIKKANEAYRKAVKDGHPDLPSIAESPEDEFSKEFETAVKSISPTSSFHPASTKSPVSPPSPRSSTSPRDFPRVDGTPIEKTSYGFNGPSPDINGSVAAQWIPYSQRPIHRPIANYGRRVDTIKWTRGRLKELAPKIAKLRSQYRKGKVAPIPAIFVEFHTQVDAQSAYQTLAHHRANHMIPEIIGVRPDEIIWSSLRFRWWERIIRRFLIQGFIAAMVIFWSLPAALIGIISSIKFLTSVSFLKWIKDLPSIILGLISGLLPAVALAMLMAAVPGILRACARQAGVPTESRVELFVQNAYFIFQIVQVFLITTLTSAASTAIESIIKDPLSARDLLSQNLPKASNFYISYFILQGLAMSATRIVHMGSVVRHRLMGNSGANPRLISGRYHRLKKIHWGSVYPVFTNMGVIAITYSLIAPIVLGVATIGLFLVYSTYRWNLLYVYSSERDTRGLHYPRALKQTLAGVYLAEICMAGLFGVKGAYGPLVMMFGLLIFTYLIHFSLNEALGPLLYNLPRTVAAEEALLRSGNDVFHAANLDDMHDVVHVHDSEQQTNGYDSDFDPSDPADQVNHGQQASRGVEGADAAVKLSATTATTYARKKFEASPIPYFIAKFDFWTPWITPDPNIKPNFLLKFLHPEIYADYHILRQQIPKDIPECTYNESVLRDAYSPPSMRKRSPRIWIPRDAAGISRQEVAHCSKVVEVTDEGAWLDERGVVSVNLEGETSRWVLRDFERIKF